MKNTNFQASLSDTWMDYPQRGFTRPCLPPSLLAAAPRLNGATFILLAPSPILPA